MIYLWHQDVEPVGRVNPEGQGQSSHTRQTRLVYTQPGRSLRNSQHTSVTHGENAGVLSCLSAGRPVKQSPGESFLELMDSQKMSSEDRSKAEVQLGSMWVQLFSRNVSLQFLHFSRFPMTCSSQLPQPYLHPNIAKQLLVPRVYFPLPRSEISLRKTSTTGNSNFERIFIYILSSIYLYMNVQFPQHSCLKTILSPLTCLCSFVKD